MKLGRSSVASVALCGLAVLGILLILVGFWPGSIGYDYIFTLLESESWAFEGHQPPTAAIATWALTFGTSAPSVLFVVKVLVYFASLAFIATSRAPLIVRIGGAVLLFSPLFLYLSPMLRNNTLEAAFLGFAIAAGASGSSKGHALAAGLGLFVATLFGQAVHPGHVALIGLYFLWRYPKWPIARLAAFWIGSVAVLWLAVGAVNLLARGVDRSSTLYVSALNGIGGLIDPGEQICLSQDIVRDGDITPEQVYADHYEHPYIYAPLWTEPVGFKVPENLTPEQRHAVIDCWFSLIAAKPLRFVGERLEVATLTLTASSLEPHFVTLWQGDDYLILNERFDEGLEVAPLGRAVIEYGRLGDRSKMGSILPYLALFLVTGFAVLFGERNRRLLVLFSAVAVGGFMLPQLLFTQHPAFRYYVQAAYVGSWLALMHVWLLAEGRLGAGLAARNPKLFGWLTSRAQPAE